jgi:hypothetical protein
MPVVAVASLLDVIDYLRGHPELERVLPAVNQYREDYGVV